MNSAETVTTSVPDIMAIKAQVRDVEGAVRIRKGKLVEGDEVVRPFLSDVEGELVKIRGESEVRAIIELVRDIEGMCRLMADTFGSKKDEMCIFLWDIVQEFRAIRTGLEERSIPSQPKKSTRRNVQQPVGHCT